jgi:hypothetical protein
MAAPQGQILLRVASDRQQRPNILGEELIGADSIHGQFQASSSLALTFSNFG